MEEMRKRYVNASVLLSGVTCLAMIVNHLANEASMYESVLPGWSFMCGLCTPLLCVWVGILLRRRFPNPRWWVQTLILLIVLFLLYRYRHFLNYWYWWKSNLYLYLAMIGTGYLVPTRMLVETGRRKGWEYLVLLLMSVFCYTAVSVVNHRLHYMSVMPELQEMEQLMERLANDTTPLLVILTAYFAVMLSFSKIGQHLGESSYFRGFVVVPALFTFLALLGNLIPSYWRWDLFLLPILVNPITVYLVVVLGNLKRRKKMKEEDRKPLKDVLMLR